MKLIFRYRDGLSFTVEADKYQVLGDHVDLYRKTKVSDIVETPDKLRVFKMVWVAPGLVVDVEE